LKKQENLFDHVQMLARFSDEQSSPEQPVFLQVMVLVTLVATITFLVSFAKMVLFLQPHLSRLWLELQEGVANCQMFLDTQQSHLVLDPFVEHWHELVGVVTLGSETGVALWR